MNAAKRTGSPTAVQWVILGGLFAVIGVGIYYAGQNPDTEWGPIVIGAMGLLGLIVRGLFRTQGEESDDGYGNR